MIQEARAHPDIADSELHLFEFPDLDRAGEVLPTHRKEREFHLGSEDRGEAITRALIAEDVDRVLGLVGGQEKRESLDVVPMRVRQQQRQVYRGAAEFLVQRETQLA